MPGGSKSADDSSERLGKTTAQECRKSTSGRRGSLKNVFAQAPYYLHEARVAGVWRRASAWRVFSRNFICPFCSLETSATRVTLRRNIFSNVKWRWFPRLEVQSRINEVGYWNTLPFRHIKTWTVHSISVLSKQTRRYATNYKQSEGNACYEGDVRVGVMPNPTLSFTLHFYTCIQFAYHRIRINY